MRVSASTVEQHRFQAIGPGRDDASARTRRIDTAMLGDLFFGPVLFVLSGEPTLERASIYVVGSLCGAVVLVGFLVAAGSLTLFFGGKGEQADLSFQVVLILASYPLDVFGGITKILLFTAVPVAFITGLPTRLVDDFDPGTAGLLLALAFAALGEITFRLGLNRYSSGSAWTRPPTPLSALCVHEHALSACCCTQRADWGVSPGRNQVGLPC
jgi:ABC-type uncharacterized transport system permease subunit